jgi:hypothetical protein
LGPAEGRTEGCALYESGSQFAAALAIFTRASYKPLRLHSLDVHCRYVHVHVHVHVHVRDHDHDHDHDARPAFDQRKDRRPPDPGRGPLTTATLPSISI